MKINKQKLIISVILIVISRVLASEWTIQVTAVSIWNAMFCLIFGFIGLMLLVTSFE